MSDELDDELRELVEEGRGVHVVAWLQVLADVLVERGLITEEEFERRVRELAAAEEEG